MDDYYLNLISWSCTNKVAIALGDTVYIWNAETGDVTGLLTQMWVGREECGGAVSGADIGHS
jgi:WD40 repeat protein